MTHHSLPPIPTAPGTDIHVPEELSRLRDLAYNMWWTWAAGGRDLWQRISPSAWARSPDPLTVLQTAPPDGWDHLLTDGAFRQLYDDLATRFDAYMSEGSTRHDRVHGHALDGGIAYLCAEFGIDHTLPFYSGGLGVLAGDHLKAASDAGVPLVAVGLLYQRGFFRQAIDPGGLQQHHFQPIEMTGRATRRVIDDAGHPLTVQIELPGSTVNVGVWRIDVGRVPLLLLDTDLPSNDPADRPITHILYVRGREMRLAQELVLGIGAVRVLAALGIEPAVWHVNEGHAAFSLIERLSKVTAAGTAPDAAVKAIKANTVFTLHTPLPAGNEVFDREIVRTHLAGQTPGLEIDDLLDLGRSGREGMFDLGALAIRLSSNTNGVSKRHGAVVTGEWEPIIGAPATYVTNGIHTPTWVGSSMARRFSTLIGEDWATRGEDPASWGRVRDADDRAIWDAHFAQKELLLRHLRTRLQEQMARHGAGPDELRGVAHLVPANRLTIVFARRFATYKRAGLILDDPDRLERILTDPARPAQLIYAGKAHPADQGGKDLIQRVFEMASSEPFRGHIFFIEGYDLQLARYLVGGADVWLNNPTPPREASGTSGMKAAANGVLNLSVLDGWWVEGHTGGNGWALGDPEDHSDAADAAALYDLLENEVAPLFHDRGPDGVPHGWVRMMKEAIATVAGPFSAQRMVNQYVDELYAPRAISD